MVLGDAVLKLETFVWILNHISRSITWSLFNLKVSYSVKCGGASLSIGQNLKLASFPYCISDP